MATEIEMKLSVSDNETLNRILSDPSLTQYMHDDYEVRTMKSIYYDTEDRQLSARKWCLRLRKEGDSTVAAFKTENRSDNAGFFTRGEWQCYAQSIESAIPNLIDLGAPRELLEIIGGKELVEVCGAEFTRTAACLYMDEGVRIEMAGDIGNLFNGTKQIPICELELELMYGDAGSLPPLCDQLCEAFGLKEEKRSKFQRAREIGMCIDGAENA